jgi:multidrug efflux pump
MSRFFIERPIFAWVVAIVIMLAGALAILSLPIAQYPTIAPPAVAITATYPGASAQTVEAAVTQVIEQQLKGLDHLLYFSSQSASSGQVTITATFQAGTNPDIAQVQVQNKVTQATPLLPTEVQQQGIVVAKSQASILLVIAVYDPTGRYTSGDVSDFLVSKMQDPINRVNGVGDLQVFGGQYAMRIWLDPYKLNKYALMPSDVRAAVTAQNAQVAAGELGQQPTLAQQQLSVTVTGQSRLQTVQQFKDIIVKTAANGATVHLSDVARVELGNESYDFAARMNGMPAAGIAVKLAPGANALNVATAVKAKAESLVPTFPPGMKLAFPVDNTTFVKLSIHDVIQTLLEAIVLVVVVMFVFLQNWRATLIPAIAVPVVLLGTFAVLAVAGLSINTLTLFALVLAIGLLVDDAIVVVENVERIMTEEGLSPREATIKSMDEVTGALVGIGIVLTTVFLPMAFFGGSTGAIYRQFSITIVAAVLLSIVVALVLTPALCATLLKPTPHKPKSDTGGGFFGWFNRNFDRGLVRYEALLSGVIRRRWLTMAVYLVLVGIMALLFIRLPSGFLPEEDQGAIIAQVNLPPGATQSRTLAVDKVIEHHFLADEKSNVDYIFTVPGFSFAGTGQNSSLAFIRLSDWSQRPGAGNRASAIVQRAFGAFAQIRDAQVFALVPPAVQELGNASGFDLELEDEGNLGHDRLLAAQYQLLGMAAADHKLLAVRPNSLADAPQLHVDIDQAKAGALGLSLADIDDTLSSAWGSEYINDFIDRGRVKRVFMQGDAPFRSVPSDLDHWYVRGSSGAMAPFSAFAATQWSFGPTQLSRYNGLPAFEVQGQPAPGLSSGAAMDEMENLLTKLPPGVGHEWTGLSYQERLSGAQAPFLYVLSILVVFLCLAALYESWSIPMAVMLVIPLGVIGAVLAATMRGLYNDIYFQVGLLTTIGLSAKNAILIVEFARDEEKMGASPLQAAMHAARMRLRPILMTSLAFIAGVTPLALNSGAGAGSQNDIGTGVIGGMLTATVLAIFFVPLFFILVRGRARTPRSSGPSNAVVEQV